MCTHSISSAAPPNHPSLEHLSFAYLDSHVISGLPTSHRLSQRSPSRMDPMWVTCLVQRQPPSANIPRSLTLRSYQNRWPAPHDDGDDDEYDDEHLSHLKIMTQREDVQESELFVVHRRSLTYPDSALQEVVLAFGNPSHTLNHAPSLSELVGCMLTGVSTAGRQVRCGRREP